MRVERFRLGRERWGSGFIRTAFTESEALYCGSKHNEDLAFAGTFAAKEAVYKALRIDWSDGFSWRWIEIDRDHTRAPSVKLAPEILDTHPHFCDTRVTVSITHAGDLAAAVALAEASQE